MKILFINLPYYGHVIPTIGLVQELIKEGNEVTYLISSDFNEVVKQSGATVLCFKKHKQLAEQIKYAYNAAEKIINEYDLIIYEQFFFLGKHLAEKYHKPVVRVFSAPATNKRLMQKFIDKGPMSIFKNKWINKAFTKDIARDIKMMKDNWLDEIVYNIPDLNLVYTLKEFQPDIDSFSEDKFKFIGPSIYERIEDEIDYIKKDKPLIYISLGTINIGAKSFFQKCIDAFSDDYYDVILSVGNKFNINSLKNIPSNIHVYRKVPQIKVLKMCDVFITHGGMNSINEAFYTNTPMVVIPISSDQFVNASCVEKLKVGIKLEYKESTLNLRKKVDEVIINNNDFTHIEKYIQNALGNKGAVSIIKKYYHNKNNI